MVALFPQFTLNWQLFPQFTLNWQHGSTAERSSTLARIPHPKSGDSFNRSPREASYHIRSQSITPAGAGATGGSNGE